MEFGLFQVGGDDTLSMIARILAQLRAINAWLGHQPVRAVHSMVRELT